MEDLFRKKYAALIQAKIEDHWYMPDWNHPPGLETFTKVNLDPTGGVTDVKVMSSSGDPTVDKMTVNAILNASPLPIPDHRACYRLFKELQIRFIVPSR